MERGGLTLKTIKIERDHLHLSHSSIPLIILKSERISTAPGEQSTVSCPTELRTYVLCSLWSRSGLQPQTRIASSSSFEFVCPRSTMTSRKSRTDAFTVGTEFPGRLPGMSVSPSSCGLDLRITLFPRLLFSGK